MADETVFVGLVADLDVACDVESIIGSFS